MTRFRATVQAVEMIGRRELVMTPVAVDPNFIVSLDVRRVDLTNVALRAGSRVNFGVHSLAYVPIDESAIGKDIAFEAVWTACGGAFRRFEALTRKPTDNFVQEFDGSLEVGGRYRAKVRRDDKLRLVLVKSLNVHVHHWGRADWTNAADFPGLAGGGGEETVVFDVAAERINRRPNQMQWLSEYEVTIVRVEKNASHKVR